MAWVLFRVLVVALLLGACASVAFGNGSARQRPPEPRLAVSAAQLRQAVRCHANVGRSRRVVVLLVHGTAFSAAENWDTGYRQALAREGHRSCTVELPERALGDAQVSAEYVVGAIRTASTRARRRIAVVGLSQGAVLPRWALKYWPSLRGLLSDVVAIAGPQHGTTLASDQCRLRGCPPAAFQQAVGSRFLGALNRGDETPSGPAWTTIRTTTDDVVIPSGGRRPSPALRGASNVSIQRVCPGREATHVDALLDSVSWAATLDAIRRRGGAAYARLGRSLCRKRFFPYAPDERVAERNAAARPLLLARILAAPAVSSEPPLRGYARRR